MIQQFYTEIVDKYFLSERNSPHSQVGQLSYYAKLCLDDAIEDGVFGRYIFEKHQYFSYHYRFFPQDEGSQVAARELLLKVVDRISAATTFLDLYKVVRHATQDVSDGLGLLFYYDTSLRIGASKDIQLSPEHVFLQRGSEEGSKASA